MNHVVNYGEMLLNANDLIHNEEGRKVKQEVRFFKEDEIQRTHTQI